MADEKKKNCDCGCDHDHDAHNHECDCGCESVDEDVILLQDEEGNDIPFYYITTLEHDGKEYVCLQQADDEDPVVEIFELQEVEENGEPYDHFLPIEDELYELLYNQLLELTGEEDDCDDPDCDCHHHHDDKK